MSILSEDSLSQGGGGKEDELDIDLTGTSIRGKSIFSTKLKESDPRLFSKRYTRISFLGRSFSQYRRQPVILTDEEKKYIDDIDKEGKTKSYDEFIRYGSGDKKFNYICPRFWCIRDKNGKGRSLSVKQINDGECGGWDALIPEKAKKVPKGKRIVEFTDERFHRENSKIPDNHPARKVIYRPMYPGFQDPSKHPDGLCVLLLQSPFTKTTKKG